MSRVIVLFEVMCKKGKKEEYPKRVKMLKCKKGKKEEYPKRVKMLKESFKHRKGFKIPNILFHYTMKTSS